MLLGHVPHRDSDVVLRPGARRADRHALEREKGSGVREQTDSITGHHRDPAPPWVADDRDGDTAAAHLPRHGQRRRGLGGRHGLAQHLRRACHHGPHQARAPRCPRLGGRRPRVRLGERQQEREGLAGPDLLGEERRRRGVLRVTGGRGLTRRRWRRTSTATRSTAAASKPMRHGDLPGQRLAGDAVLGQAALADVVQQRRHQEHVGTGHVPDQPRGLAAGLHHVAVDGEPVDLRGVREQPDPLPLGQERRERPGLVERLPHREQTRPRREEPDQRLAGPGGPGLREARALRYQTRHRCRRQLDVALGRHRRRPQEQRRVDGRARVAASALPRLPRARPPARSRPPRAGVRRAADAGRVSTPSTRRQVRRDRWVIRRPSSRTCR